MSEDSEFDLPAQRDGPPRRDLPELPQEEQPQGGVPLRPVLLIAAVLLLAFAVYTGYSCLRSGGNGSFSGPVDHFPPGSVTYLQAGGTYLVRQPDGAFIALSEQEADDADRTAGCVIRWRPDLAAAGERGVFRDDCHGVLFNRQGTAVQGSAPPMQRRPVTVSGSTVTVQLTHCENAVGTAEVCRH